MIDLFDNLRERCATLGRIYPDRVAKQQAPAVAYCDFVKQINNK